MNHNNKFELPYAIYIYIDFECLLKNIRKENNNDSKTCRKKIHTRYGFPLYLISHFNDELFQLIMYRMKEESELLVASKKLIQELIKIIDSIQLNILHFHL